MYGGTKMLAEIKERNKKSLAKHFELLDIQDVMAKAKLQNLFNQLTSDIRFLLRCLEEKEQ